MQYSLRVTAGPDEGQKTELSDERALVGRSNDAAVRLTDPDVSWEHLVITRQGERLKVANLSAHGTRLKGRAIVEPATLHVGDELQLSQATRVVIEPAEAGAGSSSGVLALIAALVLVVALVAGWSMLQLSPEVAPPPNDWARAYVYLDHWLGGQVERGQMPEATQILFRNAWRLDRSGSYSQAAKAWLDLKLMLQTQPTLNDPAARTVDARLNELLRRGPSGNETDAQNTAALLEFAQRSYRWNRRQVDRED